MPLGIPPANINNLEYAGLPFAVVPVVDGARAPGVTDRNYPIFCLWRNTTNNNAYILVGFSSGNALWRLFQFGASSGTIDQLTGNTGIAGPDASNNAFIQGDGTTVTVTGDNVNTLTISLVGGGPAMETFTVQAATVPGLVIVTPIANNVVVNGSAVAAHSVPIETRSRALGAYNVEVQYAAAVAATDATKSGLAHFNNTQFTVDANGFVALAGGGLAIDQVAVDAATGPGTNPVVPSGAGQITVTGGQVAAGTIGANVIRTDSLAANTYTIEIQRSTAVASTASLNNGVSHFDSADFTVDANGFVSLNGTNIVIWQLVTQATQPANMSVNRGYICNTGGTGLVVLPLPTTGSALGDIIEITLDGATSFQITQAAGQQIRLGNQQTTAGVAGSITTTAQGNTIRMVCQTANLKWNILSSVGNFVVV